MMRIPYYPRSLGIPYVSSKTFYLKNGQKFAEIMIPEKKKLYSSKR